MSPEAKCRSKVSFDLNFLSLKFTQFFFLFHLKIQRSKVFSWTSVENIALFSLTEAVVVSVIHEIKAGHLDLDDVKVRVFWGDGPLTRVEIVGQVGLWSRHAARASDQFRVAVVNRERCAGEKDKMRRHVVFSFRNFVMTLVT